jgi:type VI secretion system protein ImpK
MAVIYLMCLTLGFRGGLRSAGGAEQGKEWCRQLFAFAYRRDPEYSHLANILERDTLNEPARLTGRRLLPDSFRLLVIIGALIFFLILLGQLLWMDVQHKLEPGLRTPITGWMGTDEPKPASTAGTAGDGS